MNPFTEALIANAGAAAVTAAMIVWPSPQDAWASIQASLSPETAVTAPLARPPFAEPPEPAPVTRLDPLNLYDQIEACAHRLDRADAAETATCREVVLALSDYWGFVPPEDPALLPSAMEVWGLAAAKLCRREWADAQTATPLGDSCVRNLGLDDSET